MWTDPVVNEIHKIRQQMLCDAGGDFHAFMEKIRNEQAASQRRVIQNADRVEPDANKLDAPKMR